jgi:hypothetical protein
MKLEQSGIFCLFAYDFEICLLSCWGEKIFKNVLFASIKLLNSDTNVILIPLRDSTTAISSMETPVESHL